MRIIILLLLLPIWSKAQSQQTDYVFKATSDTTFTWISPSSLKSTLSLNNVTNESKATMFTNVVLTGTFSPAAGSIGNAALANSAVANLSGTNSGDNAANTTYASDYRLANFVAGTQYVAPNGNGSALTGLTPTQVGLGSVDNTSDATKNAAAVNLTNKTIATFNYAADAQANDTYVISLSPAPAAYTTGMIIFFKANTINTGAASINVNSLGAKTIVKRVNTTLANGDILALSFNMIIYDGTNFVLINPIVN